MDYELTSFDRHLWPFRHLKQLGLDQLLWSLARLSPYPPPRTLILRNLFHRLPDCLSLVLPGYIHRKIDGCRLLPPIIHRGEYHSARWYLHDLALQDVLAVHARSGPLHWCWERLLVLPQPGPDINVLLEEEGSRVGACGLRVGHWWLDLPHHGEAVVAQDRVSVDDSRHWFDTTGEFGDFQLLEQAKDQASEGWAAD